MTDIVSELRKKILLLDGAMGTAILSLNLRAQDYGGESFEGCNEYLTITRPDIVKEIHEGYLEAGADIIMTNTFAASSITLAEYGLEHKAYEINIGAAEIAKKIAKKFNTMDKPRFVAGILGPTNKTISVTQNITFEELQKSYYEQAKALVDGGVDLLWIETVFDTLNAKAAFDGIHKLFKELRYKLPISLTCTIEKNGTMLAGQDIESFYISMQHYDLLSIGINCALGPDLIKDHLRTLSAIANLNVSVHPNAGLPLVDGSFPLTPKKFAEQMREFINMRWVNIIGGCCGTTKEHIKELSYILNGMPRIIPQLTRSTLSGTESLIISNDNRPIIVGERTNVIGSRKFKELICKDDFHIAAEIGKAQVKKGAQILDVCLANPDRQELADASKFLDLMTKKIRIPIMIDSTNPEVIEHNLKQTQGKSVINSINFEDGYDRCKKILPLVKKYGAAVIFGTIDENKDQAMAITAERKFQIAQRAYFYLQNKWGINPEDIIFDTLVFPISTGEKKFADSAKSTIEAIQKIKSELPGAKTILGISNCSFGLPNAGREVINSVYLYYATIAGLDYAIVNSEKIIRYPSISTKEKTLTENLLFNKTKDPISPFVEYYRGKKIEKDKTKLPLDKRIEYYIIEGSRDGLISDLNLARTTLKPMEIINGPLMSGMSEVGKLFNENKLIVSEVLQSAESMKAAVTHLEKFMDKSEIKSKGKIILATVKGDVHDIGKNLFEIILHNNGYEVINLGIKIPPSELIEAAREYKPDIIGLSGLLVKSAEMMVTTCQDFESANLSIPVMVGGAALSEKFTSNKIAPAYKHIVVYSKDAMNGLNYVNQMLKNPEKFEKINKEKQLRYREKDTIKTSNPLKLNLQNSSEIVEAPKPNLPISGIQIQSNFKLQDVFEFINPQMLFGTHLGLIGLYTNLLKNKDPKALKLTKQVNFVKELIIKNNLFKARAIFQFFHCKKDRNNIIIYKNTDNNNNNNNNSRTDNKISNYINTNSIISNINNNSKHNKSNYHKVLATLEFPRQRRGEFLSAADYISSIGDTIGFFVTTCGDGIVELAKKFRDKGEYLTSHILQYLAIESAEALAELIHLRMRNLWGINQNLTKSEIFQAKYQGIRLSYGYPACPNLEDQLKLFNLIYPAKIGVSLTESYMMDPEASVSAIVFHHPQAKYFSV